MKFIEFEKKAYVFVVLGVLIIIGSLSNLLSFRREFFLAIGFGVMLRGVFMYIKAKNGKDRDVLDYVDMILLFLVKTDPREKVIVFQHIQARPYSYYWVLFEAGALSKSITKSRVTPFCIDIAPSDLSGPLSQFQATSSTETDLLKLMKSINNALDENNLNDALIEKLFNKWWPDLEKNINQEKESFAQSTKSMPNIRDMKEMIEEIVLLTRNINNSLSNNNYIIEKSKIHDFYKTIMSEEYLRAAERLAFDDPALQGMKGLNARSSKAILEQFEKDLKDKIIRKNLSSEIKIQDEVNIKK